MKKLMDRSYSIARNMQLSVVVLFALIAYLMFDLRTMLYVIIAMILGYEIPTLTVGIMLSSKLKHTLRKDIEEFENIKIRVKK